MTKQGSFKRAVRAQARATGQRYTEALAAAEQGRMAAPPLRPYAPDALRAHLEATYGTRITWLEPIDHADTRPDGSWEGHYPSTLVVRRDDGPAWVARVFSSTSDSVGRVKDDAEILRFLAAHDFPSERLAHEEPVSVLDGKGVLVTELIEPGRPGGDDPVVQLAVHRELGGLLGRLHALPAGQGAVARDGGAEEHNGAAFVGRPKEDLAAAMSFLLSIEGAIDASGREGFDWLRSHVEAADDAEGLPGALTHGNYHWWAAVGRPGELRIVGWAGAGRGPRLPALAWLLRTAAESGRAECVDAVVHGYREHVELTADELERLPRVLDLRPLWLACLDYRFTVQAGRTPTLQEGWTGWRPEQSDAIAARAIAALRGGRPHG